MAPRNFRGVNVKRRNLSSSRSYTWYVEVEGGHLYERDTWRSAHALASILDQFEEIQPSDRNEGFVPVEIALEGKPAIAAYLLGVHEMTRTEVAEVMGVTADTVQKYLARFNPNRYSG